jgi:hypothetical protein
VRDDDAAAPTERPAHDPPPAPSRMPSAPATPSRRHAHHGLARSGLEARTSSLPPSTFPARGPGPPDLPLADHRSAALPLAGTVTWTERPWLGEHATEVRAHAPCHPAPARPPTPSSPEPRSGRPTSGYTPPGPDPAMASILIAFFPLLLLHFILDFAVPSNEMDGVGTHSACRLFSLFGLFLGGGRRVVASCPSFIGPRRGALRTDSTGLARSKAIVPCCRSVHAAGGRDGAGARAATEMGRGAGGEVGAGATRRADGRRWMADGRWQMGGSAGWKAWTAHGWAGLDIG